MQRIVGYKLLGYTNTVVNIAFHPSTSINWFLQYTLDKNNLDISKAYIKKN